MEFIYESLVIVSEILKKIFRLNISVHQHKSVVTPLESPEEVVLLQTQWKPAAPADAKLLPLASPSVSRHQFPGI